MRKLIEWLYRRYPPKLVITVQDYTMLREEIAQLNLAAQALSQLNDRLTLIENQVKKLNDANGFVNVSKGSLRLER